MEIFKKNDLSLYLPFAASVGVLLFYLDIFLTVEASAIV